MRVLLLLVAGWGLVACSSDGTAGKTGPAGPAGIQGPAGETGSQGPPGADGEQGPAGPAGRDGDLGHVGATGPTGATGPQGTPGATGPQGDPGQQGAAGVQGPQGAPGAGPINLADVYPKTNSVVVPANQDGVIDVFCDPGDVVLGGSCDGSGGDGNISWNVNRPHFPNPPDGPGSRGWTCQAHNYATQPIQTMTINVYAICYDIP